MPRETTWKVCKIKAASMAAGEGGGSPREGASSGACAPRRNPESLTSRLDCFGAFAPRSDGLWFTAKTPGLRIKDKDKL